ncbi:hypothetical protein P3T36_003262 [Kitasatospora sp. MAP12-15]|uniref:DUF461 domain-containing protein n=1 Tax=unclassified Kitasatospora TaxID=2633591 RepID=UPI002473B5BF|nr:DUF461 domain-containing protein [Kitasatospora sp. MAP12-44]MDH6111238.1 hypothetical protein [Kitasatospora sp. MAP12-44]
MSRSLRRGGSAALVLALAAISLSACAAGPSPDTAKVQPDTPATSIGNDLKLNGIVVVTSATQTSGQPGPANVTVNISNTGSAPQTLQSLTVAGNPATFTDAHGLPLSGIVIPPLGAVLLGGAGQPSAKVPSVALETGSFTPTVFSFDQAGQVTAQAQINSASGIYASFGPASPSANASVSGAPAASGPAALPSAGASIPVTTGSAPASGPATGTAPATPPASPASPAASAH